MLFPELHNRSTTGNKRTVSGPKGALVQKRIVTKHGMSKNQGNRTIEIVSEHFFVVQFEGFGEVFNI